MSTYESKRTKIIEAMEEKGGITKTEAGIAAGYTKNRRASNEILEDLVEEGMVEEFTSDKGNTLYRLIIEEEQEEEKEYDEALYPTLEIPTDNHGFELDYNEDTRKWIVTIPYNDSVVELSPGEQLLCINEESLWKVQKPSDVFQALEEYGEEKGYYQYIVNDLETNEPVSSSSEFEDNNKVIIFLEMCRHNKAGN